MAPPVGVTAAPGFRVASIASGFSSPTQLHARGSAEDGWLLAQLNGDEDAATGQVLALDPDFGVDRVLIGGLAKPTGVAVTGTGPDRTIWVMEERRLSRVSDSRVVEAATELAAAALDVVADDLPYNGRSEGTLTVTPDGDLLYNTSGRREGDRAAAGSAALLRVDAGGESEVVASGFKHAYAHVFDADGTLWVTEIADGSYDGTPAVGEVVAVRPGADHGWPRCVDDNRPVVEFGGTEALCAAPPGSLTLFGEGATPTSIVVAPWDDETLLVALWGDETVVAIDRRTGERTVVVSGLDRPQHLTVDRDRVLVVEHGAGRILELVRG